jgi:hypothetical protein
MGRSSRAAPGGRLVGRAHRFRSLCQESSRLAFDPMSRRHRADSGPTSPGPQSGPAASERSGWGCHSAPCSWASGSAARPFGQGVGGPCCAQGNHPRSHLGARPTGYDSRRHRICNRSSSLRRPRCSPVSAGDSREVPARSWCGRNLKFPDELGWGPRARKVSSSSLSPLDCQHRHDTSAPANRSTLWHTPPPEYVVH